MLPEPNATLVDLPPIRIELMNRIGYYSTIAEAVNVAARALKKSAER